MAAAPAVAGDSGIVRKQASDGVVETVDSLVSTLEGAGLKIFARVDHGAGAVSVGEDVGASQLLIFGSPKVGTPEEAPAFANDFFASMIVKQLTANWHWLRLRLSYISKWMPSNPVLQREKAASSLELM